MYGWIHTCLEKLIISKVNNINANCEMSGFNSSKCHDSTMKKHGTELKVKHVAM
jgi:hypothetical protein